MTCILLATCNVDFALVDEREKNIMQEELVELGALNSNLQLGDDEMPIETIEVESSIDELVDAPLGINYAQSFHLNVDPHLVDVDDVDIILIKRENIVLLLT
jgi:hypothetical protein